MKEFIEHFQRPSKPFGIQDWNEIAPNTKMSFILFNPRSGSTYIGSILQQMDDIGKSSEFLNVYGNRKISNKENLCFKNYLRELSAQYTRNSVFSMQSGWYNFNNCVENNFIDPSFFSEKNVHCYILLRRNIVLESISFIQAMDTNIWHFSKNNYQNYINREGSNKITDQRIFEFIRVFLYNELKIFNFFYEQNIEPTVFFYEDLISAPFLVIEKLYRDKSIYFDTNKFNFCITNPHLTQKIYRENTLATYINFLNQYPFIEELLNLRIQNFSKQLLDNLLPNIIKIIDSFNFSKTKNKSNDKTL